MARITVEDCLEHVQNRYALVHLCTRRARQLFQGSDPMIECKNGNVVTALREIAANYVQFIPDSESQKQETGVQNPAMMAEESTEAITIAPETGSEAPVESPAVEATVAAEQAAPVEASPEPATAEVTESPAVEAATDSAATNDSDNSGELQ